MDHPALRQDISKTNQIIEGELRAEGVELSFIKSATLTFTFGKDLSG